MTQTMGHRMDVVVMGLDHGVLVMNLLHDEVCALGATEPQAMEAFHALCAHLWAEEPDYFALPLWEEATTHAFKCDISGYVSGQFVPFSVQLVGVVGRTKEGGSHVFLPQLGVQFHIHEVSEHLGQMVTEFLREQYGLYERLEALGQLGPPLVWKSQKSILSQGEIALRRVHIQRPKGHRHARPAAEESTLVTLESVGIPLHRTLGGKDASRAWEREDQVKLLMEYMSGAFDRSVLLVGEQGVGKTALVHEMVRQISQSECPESLRGVGVWQISGGRLMAGMKYLGQWQERVLEVISEAKQSGAILFIENIMEFLDVSGKQEGQGMPNLLLPALRSGELALIAEARPEQLAQATQRHPQMMRVLRTVRLPPLSVPQTDSVLEHVSFRLGRQHGVRLSQEARQKILELVSRFQTQQALPGPAVDLAKRVAQTHHQESAADPESPRRLLGPMQVIEAYAEQTGLPRPLIDPSVAFEVSEVRACFEREIFDQPEAIASMVNLVTIIRSGLHPPGRPLGSFLFLGPTGVGKTQTALTLAEYLFGHKNRLVRFDMSEFQDAWSAGRLVGRVQGEGGELVKKVRAQPFCVVLLDEIEKAHPAVFDLLLQALGEGRLTDGHGQTVSLCNTAFIMTSNLGSQGGSAGGRVGFQQGEMEGDRAKHALHYQRAAEQFFRPEFVGRIDRVIPFLPLAATTAQKLVEKTLRQAFAREGLRRRDIVVVASQEVRTFLISRGFDQRYGARPLRQAVEVYITAPLAEFLASRKGVEKTRLRFEMGEEVPYVVQDRET